MTMLRACSLLWCSFFACTASTVLAQHSHQGYPGGHYHYHGGYAPIMVAPVWIPYPAPQIVPVVSVLPSPIPATSGDPAKRPAKPSTPAGRLKSLEYQARGDDKLRKQLWAQAYLSYRSAE